MSLRNNSQLLLQNITVDQLVEKDHVYRTVIDFFDFKKICKKFNELYSDRGAPGFEVEKGVKALILQFMEDYSDRQMARALKENNAVKWFCGFELLEETPHYCYFSRLRERLGTKNISILFNFIKQELEKRNLVGECFTFVDSSAIITKTQLWAERDKAIEAGEKKINNATIKEYAADPNARFGCKGKDKYWFGYKRHVSVDTKAGVVTKVAVTPANVSDAQGLKYVCPKSGMALADKAYSGNQAQQTMKTNGCHSGAILKNNMKQKNFDRDRWISQLRMPFEGVFSFFKKRARYRRQAKVQYQAFMEAIAWNIKVGIKYSKV
jgi:transposase, IS5 family